MNRLPPICHYPENREDTGWRASYRYLEITLRAPAHAGLHFVVPSDPAGSDSSIGLAAPMTDELWSPTGADTIFMFRGAGRKPAWMIPLKIGSSGSLDSDLVPQSFNSSDS